MNSDTKKVPGAILLPGLLYEIKAVNTVTYLSSQ